MLMSKTNWERLTAKQRKMYKLIQSLEEGGKRIDHVPNDDPRIKKLNRILKYDGTAKFPRQKRKKRHYLAILNGRILCEGKSVPDVARQLQVSNTVAEGYRSRRNNKNPKGIVIMKIGDCCQIGEHCGKHKN